jgi:hypothetical protein
MSHSFNWVCNLGSDKMEIQAAEITFLRGRVGKTITDKIKNKKVRKGKIQKVMIRFLCFEHTKK